MPYDKDSFQFDLVESNCVGGDVLCSVATLIYVDILISCLLLLHTSPIMDDVSRGHRMMIVIAPQATKMGVT